MMTIEANLVVNGGSLTDYTEDVQNEFVLRYNEIVDELNAALPRLNKMFENRVYAGDLKEGSWLWHIYGQFISNYERDLCLQDNCQTKNYESRIFMDSINICGVPTIIGIIDRDPNKFFMFIDSSLKHRVPDRR